MTLANWKVAHDEVWLARVNVDPVTKRRVYHTWVCKKCGEEYRDVQ
jgi:formylmethanofuran dehydrogenase subunit E